MRGQAMGVWWGNLELNWDRYELIRPGILRHSKGRYIYSTERVMGIRTPFESRSIELEHPLEDGRLHLIGLEEHEALELKPFICLRPSPPTAANACYFYNRRKPGKIRLVSYHFEDESELWEPPDDIGETLAQLQAIGSFAFGSDHEGIP